VRYQEPLPSNRWKWSLLILFLLLYLPALTMRELAKPEAISAAIAADLRWNHWMPLTVQGQQVPAFPLYPWLVRLCRGRGLVNELTVRLPAALAVLALASLCAWVAARNKNMLSGVIAAAMVLTCYATLSYGQHATADTLTALLLSGAWFSWYELGRVGKSWNLAWPTSLTLVLLAVFAGGAEAILYFYFPLLFLRRPLYIDARLRMPAHWLSVVVGIAILAFWYHCFPDQILLSGSSLAMNTANSSIRSYFVKVMLFPLQSAAWLLPWTFLAWPPFCAGHRAVEPASVLCRYLRAVVVTLFVACWFLPDVSPIALLPVLGPLAVMTGLHYEILVRRHFHRLERLLPALWWPAVLLAATTGAAGSLHVSRLLVWPALSISALLPSLVLSLMALVLAYLLRKHPAICNRPYRLRLILTIAALALAISGGRTAWEGAVNRHRQRAGQLLAAAIPGDVTIYKFSPNYLLPESHYLQRPVRSITSMQELPADKPEVYVLAGRQMPILESRSWRACSPHVVVRVRPKAALLWRSSRAPFLGVVNEISQSTDQVEDQRIVRMYCGVLRQREALPAPTPSPAAAIQDLPPTTSLMPENELSNANISETTQP